jgi:hypothetical protein
MKSKQLILLLLIPLSEIKAIFYYSDLKVDWYLFSDEKRYSSKDEKFIDYSLRIQNFATKYKIAVIDLSQVSNDVKR